MTIIPSWFLAHGAPFYALGEHVYARFWGSLANSLTVKPKAILCLSAHWQTTRPTLAGHQQKARIQYDFSGFPASYYKIQWPLPDAREAGAYVLNLLREAGIACAEQATRPLDHGVWVPLCRIWPAMSIPILQLSLCKDWHGQHYLQLGEQLASLRQQGILFIGSGSLTHNLHDLDRSSADGEARPWAMAFMHELEHAIAERDFETLANPWQLVHGKRALPSLEHYWPLLPIVAMHDKPLQPIFQQWAFRTLAMHSYRSES